MEGTEGSGVDAGEMNQMDTGGGLVYRRVYDKGKNEKG